MYISIASHYIKSAFILLSYAFTGLWLSLELTTNTLLTFKFVTSTPIQGMIPVSPHGEFAPTIKVLTPKFCVYVLVIELLKATSNLLRQRIKE